MSYTDNLRATLKQYQRQVDVITKVKNQAGEKLDHKNMKHVGQQGVELKKAIGSAMKGDSAPLMNFVNNANTNK